MLVKIKRKKRPFGLSLVALMDVFTVLVFFLMFHFGDDQAMTNKYNIDIPESAVANSPDETPVISVFDGHIYLNEHLIADYSETVDNVNNLNSQFSDALGAAHHVSIVADSAVRYTVIDELIDSLETSQVANVSLVVQQTK